MIDIARERLPKEYERVILEEYYNLFTDMYGATNPIFRGRKTFSTDESKLTKKDLLDPILTASIGALESVYEDDNLEFVLNKESDGRISAVARIRVTEGSDIHIADVLFLEYQSDEEKEQIISAIIVELEEYARCLDCNDLYYEIPKFDDTGKYTAIKEGFTPINEPKKVTSAHRTYVFHKSLNLIRGVSDGCTRSRKQTQGNN